VLNTDVDECIIVLGHFKDEIKKEILKINDDRIKVVYNNPKISIYQSNKYTIFIYISKNKNIPNK
ncbi:MAG: hypothetical protein LBD03_07230, partial [Methanobrevibacter sp.]|nr:hypothetical protein [Candidatus Methanovirga procula]